MFKVYFWPFKKQWEKYFKPTWEIFYLQSKIIRMYKRYRKAIKVLLFLIFYSFFSFSFLSHCLPFCTTKIQTFKGWCSLFLFKSSRRTSWPNIHVLDGGENQRAWGKPTKAMQNTWPPPQRLRSSCGVTLLSTEPPCCLRIDSLLVCL